ncbi:N-6 DNA methylase [Kovacikia minuta CCNUW1]|uniref:N-6 DNA methylase n=1 Tax=Kovacikia minuta TaxID=2931930 RepID=UPI001CCDAA59|nr:N-6 DNA methylase [Kovacikia minuta]UBF29300.1 N-6 DNA methylase [Kovacikia minuta CCNUW1]
MGRKLQQKEIKEQQLILLEEPLSPLDYKEAYRQIRNYLAGRYVGATRDEALLAEVIKCLFCKLYLRKQGVQFTELNTPLSIAKEYRQAFLELRDLLPAIFGLDSLFNQEEDILLDAESLTYVDQKLEGIDLDNWNRDPFGDAYEVFVGSVVRGQEGQFFTPQNAIELLVSIVDPRPGEKIIDPACGAGGFLNATARHLVASGLTPYEIADSIFGVDKDRYLVSLASARLSLITLSSVNVLCADSLIWENDDENTLPLKNLLGTFDAVITNPPFGSRIVSVSPDIQALFQLGYAWRPDRQTGKYIKQTKLQSTVPPQVLFVERCLSLVKPGGRLGMVVPESLISGRNYRHVVDFIRKAANIKAVLGMPESLFKISGKGGTHTKTCLILLQKKDENESDGEKSKIYMAEAKWCGHDSRGKQNGRDELTEIAIKYRKFLSAPLKEYSHLGYQVEENQIVDHILAPRYYNPEVYDALEELKETHDLVKLGDLISSKLVRVTTGDEIGKLSYGTGAIPFVRTSDISNWEVKLDPKHGVSESIYKMYAKKQDVQEGDILMVRDGTYLIGTCAFITKYDTQIVFQSHLYKLRIMDHSKLSPYLLLAALSCEPVQQQIKAKRFTQDIIDSLGDRINELVLPIPKDISRQERITSMVKKAIDERVEARELARQACLDLIDKSSNHFT